MGSLCMRLSWNEIRARAAAFAEEWQDAAYEKGETQSFYNDFFNIFGVKRRTVARYEEHVKRLDNSSGYIDLFWPGVTLVEHLYRSGGFASGREREDDSSVGGEAEAETARPPQVGLAKRNPASPAPEKFLAPREFGARIVSNARMILLTRC